jgi:hypothetical protein
MKAIVSIKRSDLFLVSLYMLPRAHSNYVVMGILGLGVFAFLLFREQCISVRTIFVAAVASIGGAIGGLLGGFAVSTLMMLITVGNKSGVLGVHEYTLSLEGTTKCWVTLPRTGRLRPIGAREQRPPTLLTNPERTLRQAECCPQSGHCSNNTVTASGSLGFRHRWLMYRAGRQRTGSFQ